MFSNHQVSYELHILYPMITSLFAIFSQFVINQALKFGPQKKKKKRKKEKNLW